MCGEDDTKRAVYNMKKCIKRKGTSQQYVSEDDLNAVVSQIHFETTLQLKVGHGAKGKKEKINKYL